MSRTWKPNRPTVELSPDAPRPSRIRRDPPPQPAALRQTVLPDVAEREARTVVIGVMLFGVAIAIIIIAVGNYLGR